MLVPTGAAAQALLLYSLRLFLPHPPSPKPSNSEQRPLQGADFRPAAASDPPAAQGSTTAAAPLADGGSAGESAAGLVALSAAPSQTEAAPPPSRLLASPIAAPLTAPLVAPAGSLTASVPAAPQTTPSSTTSRLVRRLHAATLDAEAAVALLLCLTGFTLATACDLPELPSRLAAAWATFPSSLRGHLSGFLLDGSFSRRLGFATSIGAQARRIGARVGACSGEGRAAGRDVASRAQWRGRVGERVLSGALRSGCGNVASPVASDRSLPVGA